MKEKRKKKSTNVLIVEDEKDLCYLLELAIRNEKLSTACANSLHEARQTIHNIEPNVLFVDNHRPDGSGNELIPQIKSLYPAVKVIMITAYDTPGDMEEAFNNGADYFISKPFSISAIKNVLAKFEFKNIA
ncbi:MAG: response regulator [Ginsengibacter sp.]